MTRTPAFAQTKFYPPHLRSDLLIRPRLVTALDRAVTTHPFTLLSAPAGYGKTTLLAQWIARCRWPGAWLSLDEGDNDLVRFLGAVFYALQTLGPAPGAAMPSLLGAAPSLPYPQEAQMRPMVGTLVNDILDGLPNPFVLVIDDLHLLTQPPVYLALDYLLERLPPQMHLVVATRHDPPLSLARLRARGQLAELRLPDLRFTPAETADLANDQLALALSAEELAALYAITEGWPASLRLLAISLRQSASPADRRTLLTHLAHTDRYVFDFLAEEVLNRQSQDVRVFLLQTSILDELTPGLCRAVTGRPDAAALLQDLEHRSLFLSAVGVPPDRVTAVYRYHPLFAEFLRGRLGQEMPGDVAELHRRAARAQPVPARAIPHYLAAQDWDAAAEAMEQVGQTLFYQGNIAATGRWIAALPEAVLAARPRLNLLLGEYAFQQGEWPLARLCLERAAQHPGDHVGEALAMLASCALLQNDWVTAAGLVEQALQYPLTPFVRVHLLMNRAWLAAGGQDWDGVQANVVAAVDLALEAVARSPSEGEASLLTLAFYLKPGLVALPGVLPRVESFYRRAEQITDAEGLRAGPLRLAVEELGAFIHLWRGHLDEAARAARNALALKERLGGYPFAGLDALACLAFVHVARGEDAQAVACAEEVLRQAQAGKPDMLDVALGLFTLGRIYALQGRREELRDVYTHFCALDLHEIWPLLPALHPHLLLEGLLQFAERRYEAAEGTFRRALEWEEQVPILRVYANPRLLLARLYLEQNRPQAALAHLALLLAYCEEQNTPGLILKEGATVVPLLRLALTHNIHAAFVSRLLAILGPVAARVSLFIPETGETLTAREVEVLHLLMAGCSNREIAAQLVLSEATVKTHLAHIFQKMDVSTRRQAVARARELL